MTRGKKYMLWALACLILIISGILIWFNLPYSPVKAEFAELVAVQTAKMPAPNGNFTRQDIAGLPLPVQRHFQYCGYIGTPKMWNMKAEYKDVDFVLSPDKPSLKIKYTQYNYAEELERLALIDAKMAGIPFEGIDAYQNGAGSMIGVIAKSYTLFDQKGEAMDSASLVTCLAECLLIPNLALQDYISWEAMDETHAKAVIHYYGRSASGIFTFDEQGAMNSFTTDDREYTDIGGNTQKVKWSAVCEDYREVNGIKYPTTLKAIWHFETGDLIYFVGRDVVIKYDVKE